MSKRGASPTFLGMERGGRGGGKVAQAVLCLSAMLNALIYDKINDSIKAVGVSWD